MALTVVVEQTGIPNASRAPRTWRASLEDRINEASTLRQAVDCYGEQEDAERSLTHSARRLNSHAWKWCALSGVLGSGRLHRIRHDTTRFPYLVLLGALSRR